MSGFPNIFTAKDIAQTIPAFYKVVQFFKDLFNDPIGTLQSVASNIGDFLMDVFKPIGDAFTKAKNWIKEKIGFGDSGGDGGGRGFNLSELFGDLDFSFLDPTKIASKIGEMINNALQSFAQSLDKSIVPGTGSLAKMIANAGVGIAEFMGAENIKKFNVDAKGDNKMEMIKTAAPPSTTDGAATGELSKDVAAKKEGGGGTTVVDQSQKSGDVVTQNSSTSVAQDKPNARKSNPASGKI